jgi:hypothetical protein
MPSTSETGHAKNVANFEDLISFCTGYGAVYNPANPQLTIAQLTTLQTNAKNAIDALKPLKTDFDRATNDRVLEFEDLKSLSTKVTNAFAICGADDEAVKDVQTINRKMQGARAGKEPAPDPANPAAPVPATHSTSQQSYDSLIENYSKLIVTVSKEPLYKPNEVELQVATLNVKLSDMKTKNTNVANTYTPYSNARITRDELLYDKDNGLVAIALDVKKYVKSIFGATSPEYKQVNGLEFKARKI